MGHIECDFWEPHDPERENRVKKAIDRTVKLVRAGGVAKLTWEPPGTYRLSVTRTVTYGESTPPTPSAGVGLELEEAVEQGVRDAGYDVRRE